MLATVTRHYLEDKLGGKTKELFAVSIMLIPGGTDANIHQDRIDLDRLLVHMKNSETCFVAPNPDLTSSGITVYPVLVDI